MRKLIEQSLWNGILLFPGASLRMGYASTMSLGNSLHLHLCLGSANLHLP